MRTGQPSTTAQRVALRRATHQFLDNPRVFDDPVALRIIGQETAAALQAGLPPSMTTPLEPYLRASLAARSRYAEDELALAFERGVSQYAVLGAGLDTFAYRNLYPEGSLHVFEVDHPDTQAWKRSCLEEVGIALPPDLTFAPVDFEQQTLADGLRAAGHDASKSTFFSWLGVTPYLATEAIMATLRFVASAPAGSGIVFDYVISPSLLTPAQMSSFNTLSRRVAAAGEPWQSFFDPEMLRKDLLALGFSHVEDNGPEQTNARYFKDRQDGLRVGSLSHLVSARV